MTQKKRIFPLSKAILYSKYIIANLRLQFLHAYYIQISIPGTYQWEDSENNNRSVHTLAINVIGELADSYRIIYTRINKDNNAKATETVIEKWIGFYQSKNRALVNDLGNKICMFVPELELLCYAGKEFKRISYNMSL